LLEEIIEQNSLFQQFADHYHSSNLRCCWSPEIEERVFAWASQGGENGFGIP
jgi:hypothetical protein